MVTGDVKYLRTQQRGHCVDEIKLEARVEEALGTGGGAGGGVGGGQDGGAFPWRGPFNSTSDL